MLLRLLVVLALAAAVFAASDKGVLIDPNGLTATIDKGAGIDPNGESPDDGPGIDPDGGGAMDPNG